MTTRLALAISLVALGCARSHAAGGSAGGRLDGGGVPRPDAGPFAVRDGGAPTGRDAALPDAGPFGEDAAYLDVPPTPWTRPPREPRAPWVGECGPECACAHEDCVYSCASGGCDAFCEGDTVCRGSCPGGGCGLVCDVGAECELDCAGGACAVSCETGATCHVGCAGGRCEVDCAEGAECHVDCRDGDCRVRARDALLVSVNCDRGRCAVEDPTATFATYVRCRGGTCATECQAPCAQDCTGGMCEFVCAADTPGQICDPNATLSTR